MSRKIFTFGKQNEVGKEGEALFLANYPDWQHQSENRRSLTDFINPKTGETLELKTDSYCMDATPNYFIERYSSDQNMKPGGPWRQPELTTYWVYLFLKQGIAHWFCPQQLINEIHRLGLDNEKKLCKIRNGTYSTLGWKINRLAIQNVLIEEEHWK